MRPDHSCYGLTSKESTTKMHVDDKQVDNMMGKFKDARMGPLPKLPQENHAGIKGAKKTGAL